MWQVFASERLRSVNDKEKQDIGEIAHRLNDVLTGVLGNIDLARIYLENKEPRHKVLEDLSDADALFPEVIELIQSLFDLSDEGAQNT